MWREVESLDNGQSTSTTEPSRAPSPNLTNDSTQNDVPGQSVDEERPENGVPSQSVDKERPQSPRSPAGQSRIHVAIAMVYVVCWTTALFVG